MSCKSLQEKSTIVRMLYASFAVFLSIFFFTLSGNAQQIAFPGAEGAGRFTSGGRGTAAVPTTVFEVTNLNDDNNPGSLRYALTQPATYRTVVFRVSGTIRLTSALNVRSNTTIAGQTAPGDGICIADKPLTINGDNIIIRYIRVRLGDRYQQAVNGNDDALSGTGRKNIIIDHCSMSWSNDEAFTIYDGDSTTLQWNIISEPLNYSYHDEGSGIQNHGFGGIWGGRKTSAHHNLIVHCIGRTPRFAGSRTLSPFTAGLENVDFRNNVIYNWGSYSTNGGEGGNYNMVNNYYKYGPSTGTGNSVSIPVRGMIVQPSKSTSPPVLPYGQFYLQGNHVDGYPAITSNNWLGVSMSGGAQADTTQAKATSPFDMAPVTTHSATEAYELVLQMAGASYKRDTLDVRIANDVRNRTGKIINVQGGFPWGTPFSTSISAWPALQSLPAPADDDRDGMPNSWETANGLNPNDAADRGLPAANGFTNLENYLNSIVSAPSISTSVTGFNNFTQNVGVPSVVQTYTVSGTNLAGNLTVTPPAGYQVSADGGATWVGNSSSLTLNQSAGNLASSVISVRLNAAAAGTYNGSITHSSQNAATVSIPVNGTAVAASIPAGTHAVVAKDGSGNYTTIQAAIDAAPAGRTTPYIIFIKNGKYREKVIIPSNKPFIQLIGESSAYTIVSWGDGASTPAAGGGTVGTFNSYTLFVQANDCALMNLTVENTFGDGSQAVALRVDGDRIIVRSCRLLGNQDTLLNNANAGHRQYFRNCYIDGNVDFIFGSARVILDSTVIYAKDRTVSGNSYITAANTQAGQPYGYVFRNSILPPNLGLTNYFLGRPWQNSTGSNPYAHNKTVFLNSRMGSSIRPEGWSIWDAGTNTGLIYYGEYQTRKLDGTLVNTASRVSWSKQLSDAEAASYTDANLFGTWDPCAAGASFCETRSAEIAISNFRGRKLASGSQFDWNISWAMPQITYELYRSATRGSGYVKVGEVTSQEDTTYNFQLTDVLPPAGSVYYYYVVGSKSGLSSHVTDTVLISNVPTITTSGSLNAFSQNYGSPSSSQTFVASGVNLVGNITITPAAPFEVSTNGTTWFSSSNPLLLTPTGGTVANTNISVRLNANALGTYSGNIVLTTSGGQSVNVPVTGTSAIIPQPTSVVLLQWPLTSSASDDAAVRSEGVAPSTPTFNRLTLSNGTTVASIPAYSATFGQAFGASTNGDGSWGTAVTGPGGNLTRVHYEQFTVSATSGYAVKVDSLLFSSAFYNTSSNTKVAVVYSRTGFLSDSADVSTNPGTFASPISLANQTGGPTNRYAVAFNDATGVTINAGQTLTFRLYFSCGSTSAGRYAFLKDVVVKGKATNVNAPAPVVSTTGSINAFTQVIGAPSAAQNYTVSGSNLSGAVYVIAPDQFEISNDGGSSWKNSSQPVVLNPVNGSLASTTIHVRLNAPALGAYNGQIQHLSTGASTVNVPVSGSTVPPAQITVSGTLNPFVHTVGTPSAPQTYTVSGANLQGNIVVTPPAGFEVSSNGTTWFTSGNPLSLVPASGNVTATVQVRMNAASAGTHSGNITHASSGVTTRTVAVSGTTMQVPALTVTQTITPFRQILPAPSTVQSYVLSGSNLLNPVTITPPFRYEISIDGGATWSTAPVQVVPVNGSVNQQVMVRLRAGTFGTYNGTVLNTVGNVSVPVPVEGVVTKEDYTLFPNPVYRTLFITHPVSSETATISIYNLAGIQLRTYNVVPNSYMTRIPVGELVQGAYLAEYRNGKNKVVMKFIRY